MPGAAGQLCSAQAGGSLHHQPPCTVPACRRGSKAGCIRKWCWEVVTQCHPEPHLPLRRHRVGLGTVQKARLGPLRAMQEVPLVLYGSWRTLRQRCAGTCMCISGQGCSSSGMPNPATEEARSAWARGCTHHETSKPTWRYQVAAGSDPLMEASSGVLATCCAQQAAASIAASWPLHSEGRCGGLPRAQTPPPTAPRDNTHP
jgi:hypothetical protein